MSRHNRSWQHSHSNSRKWHCVVNLWLINSATTFSRNYMHCPLSDARWARAIELHSVTKRWISSFPSSTFSNEMHTDRAQIFSNHTCDREKWCKLDGKIRCFQPRDLRERQHKLVGIRRWVFCTWTVQFLRKTEWWRARNLCRKWRYAKRRGVEELDLGVATYPLPRPMIWSIQISAVISLAPKSRCVLT